MQPSTLRRECSVGSIVKVAIFRSPSFSAVISPRKSSMINALSSNLFYYVFKVLILLHLHYSISSKFVNPSTRFCKNFADSPLRPIRDGAIRPTQTAIILYCSISFLGSLLWNGKIGAGLRAPAIYFRRCGVKASLS